MDLEKLKSFYSAGEEVPKTVVAPFYLEGN